MGRASLLERWLIAKPSEATRSEAEAVMKDLGMQLRNGGRNHLIGFHPGLVGHPQFRNGMITVNCHYGRRPGAVHPRAIDDIVRVAKYLRQQGS